MLRTASILLLALVPAFVIGGGAGEKVLVVDPSDGNGPKLGGSWESYNDENNLGTRVTPFAMVKDGSPKDAKEHGHFSGHLGKNKDPWPWAVLDLAFADGAKDVSGYTHLRFMAKGDGKKHRVRLGRTAVTDYCDFEYVFVAPKEWTKIEAPLKNFKQAAWGKQVDWAVNDVNKVGFLALANGDDEDFELRFANVEFVAKKD